MKKTMNCYLLVFIVLVVLFAGIQPASAQIVNAYDTGWYTSSGYHYPDNLNYIVGFVTPPYNNWFAFNLPSISSWEYIVVHS